jgi:hypothetical protein
MLRELWRASDPDTPIGGNWRANTVSHLTTLWWVLFGLAPLALLAASGTDILDNFSLDMDDARTARLVIDQESTAWIDTALTVGAAIAFALLVRRLTDRHARLTGEDLTPGR